MSRIGKTDVQKAFHRILEDERDRLNVAFAAPRLDRNPSSETDQKDQSGTVEP